MSSISSRTLQTCRRSSGFSVQQQTPTRLGGCDFHTGPRFSLSYCSYWKEKGLLGSAAQKVVGNPSPQIPTFSKPLNTNPPSCLLFWPLCLLLPFLAHGHLGTSPVPCSGFANLWDSRTSEADLHAEVYQSPHHDKRAKIKIKSVKSSHFRREVQPSLMRGLNLFNTGSAGCHCNTLRTLNCQEAFLGQVRASAPARVQSTSVVAW